MEIDVLAEVVRGALVSANESGREGNAANVVDAIFACGRIICYGLKQVAANDHSSWVADGLAGLARAVNRVADALGGNTGPDR
jgi:hypothetical protein